MLKESNYKDKMRMRVHERFQVCGHYVTIVPFVSSALSLPRVSVLTIFLCFLCASPLL